MGEETWTPTHRRRSSSLTLAAGSQRTKERQSTHLLNGNNGDRILEESDAGLSGSDLDLEELRSDEELHDDEETGLTHAERRKRRRRKRRNTLLDERIVGDSEDATAERMATASVVHSLTIDGLLVVFWYCCSISISVYNKWMFSKENLDFHFPLFTTSLHMLVQFTLASAVLYFIPKLRPRLSETPEYTQLDGADPAAKSSKQPLMTRWFYLSRIGPCGTATALDIGLGNFSLRFISLTFFTMCKSSVLAFVLVFAFVFRLEKPTLKLCGIIVVMTVGVIMMVTGETAFNALGFILVMTASFCSGFRWSLTQILLLRNPATSNPFSSIFFLTPIMFLALVVLALPIEGPANLIDGLRALAATKGALLGTAIMLFPGFLAFLMVAAEFALLKRTSVVTLSVCGIFKEVLTISAAGIVFGDELSPINISGLVVTILSIAAYNYVKYSNMQKEARQEAHEILEDDTESVPLRDSSEQQDARHGRLEEDEGRRSTIALIRNSLNLATDMDGHVERPLASGATVNGGTNSPLKRPEDLK
ncbi:hypothetical protein LTR36_003625 [Oleoguttula mirabilis]|uniref:Sugar phosphate transporter domain-containing protein n=1 Tax=Oleoguttula mirabilis TaxID=1507867 RepID=A0AAV9JIH4_9PEZI|nr:hypothetical protein LTR36_003625 [Oleoguttula mirabilis]